MRKGIGRPKILRPGLVDVVAADGLDWILLCAQGQLRFYGSMQCQARFATHMQHDFVGQYGIDGGIATGDRLVNHSHCCVRCLELGDRSPRVLS
jgi:hypothetical protein